MSWSDMVALRRFIMGQKSISKIAVRCGPSPIRLSCRHEIFGADRHAALYGGSGSGWNGRTPDAPSDACALTDHKSLTDHKKSAGLSARSRRLPACTIKG